MFFIIYEVGDFTYLDSGFILCDKTGYEMCYITDRMAIDEDTARQLDCGFEDYDEAERICAAMNEELRLRTLETCGISRMLDWPYILGRFCVW